MTCSYVIFVIATSAAATAAIRNTLIACPLRMRQSKASNQTTLAAVHMVTDMQRALSFSLSISRLCLSLSLYLLHSRFPSWSFSPNQLGKIQSEERCAPPKLLDLFTLALAVMPVAA